jgi:hypothetical protein
MYMVAYFTFTLDIIYCHAIIQTMNQTQVINLRGLLRYFKTSTH